MLRLLIGAAFLVATSLAAGAGAASAPVTVTFDVASSLTLTNACRSTAATTFGVVQPNIPVTTSTSAPCTVSMSSTNDTAMLRLGIRDGVAPAMTSPSTSWNTGAGSSGRTILGLAAYDGNQMAAITMGGMILRTSNGGASWVASYGHVDSHWGYDLEFEPGNPNRLVTVGGGARVESTANAMSSLPGAATWTSHTAALNAALDAAGHIGARDAAGVAVKDALTWVVSGAGYAAITTNGGTSFTAYLTDPSWLFLTDVDRVGADEYLASSSDGRLYRATSAPTSWASWTPHANGDLQFATDLAVGSATSAYMTTRGGLVHRWNGTTLTNVSAPDMRGSRLFGIATSVANPAIVTAVGDHGQTWRSTDSGTNWTRRDANTLATYHAAAMPSTTTTWAAGSAATISASTDSGVTWAQSSGETPRPAAGVGGDPARGRTAVVVGEGGSWRRTTDGGTTWTAAASMGSTDLFDVEFATSQLAWAVGRGGGAYRSVDGGASWATATSAASNTLVSVSAADDRRGWAVGHGGTIVRTTDGGATWTTQVSGTTRALSDVVALDAQTAIAVGTFGTMLRTTDGGATWAPPASPPSGTYSWVSVATPGDGSVVVADFFGNPRRSTDGGATWTTVGSSNIASDIAAIESSADGSTLALVSWFGGYQVSSDGGLTWRWRSHNQGWGGHAMHVVDPHTAIVTFDHGRILDIDESSTAASRLADYGAGATFGSAGTTSTFGVCVQSATGSIQPGWTVDPGGSCTATDSDPWRGVPATPTNLLGTAVGATGTVQLVWGARTRADQPSGRYSAAVVFEAVAPGP